MSTLTPFATVQDLVSRWKPLDLEEEQLAMVKIADVSNKLRIQARRFNVDIDVKYADDELYRMVVVRIVCDMVRKAMNISEDGPVVSQFGETAGPFSISGTYYNPQGDLFLTREEKRDLGFVGGNLTSLSMLQGDIDHEVA